MRQPQVDQWWLDHLQGKLHADEAISLREALSDNPLLLDELLDERVVDSLLRRASPPSSDAAAFIDRCKTAYASHRNSVDSRETAEPNKNLNGLNPQRNVPPVFNPEPAGNSIDQAFFQLETDLLASRRPNKTRQRFSFKSIGWITIAAAVVVIVVGGVVIQSNHRDGSLTAGNEAKDKNDPTHKRLFAKQSSTPDKFDRDAHSPRITNSQPDDVVTVEKQNTPDNSVVSDETGVGKNQLRNPVNLLASENAQWETVPDPDEMSETVSIRQGNVSAYFSDGSQIKIIGPAQVDIHPHDDAVFVKNGIISANVSDISQLQISTPLTTLGKSNASRFDLRVEESGDSELLLRQGNLELTQRRKDKTVDRAPQDTAADVIQLDFDGLNQALSQAIAVTPVDSKPIKPVVCMAQGNGGFKGQIFISGDSVSLESPTSFSQLLDQIAGSQPHSGAQFLQRWHEFSIGLENQQREHRFPGKSGIKDMPEFEQFFRQFDEQLNHLQQRSRQNFGDVPRATSTNFQGVINVNGREMRFSSPEEFDRAIRQRK